MSIKRYNDEGDQLKKGVAVGHGIAPTVAPQRQTIPPRSAETPPWFPAQHQPKPLPPRASDEMTYPLMKILIDGSVVVESAPDTAYFPLTLLEPHERTKGIVSTSGNKVVISPTDGPDVVYIVTGYNFDLGRFTAEKAEITDA